MYLMPLNLDNFAYFLINLMLAIVRTFLFMIIILGFKLQVLG